MVHLRADPTWKMEIVTFLGIHLIVPAIGVLIYAWLCVAMRRKAIEAPPYLQLFILFFTYGGILIVALTALFWRWSGAASLGCFYLLFGAPLVLACCAASVKRDRSQYHRATFILSLAYYVFWLPVFIVFLL